jgi:hypothetical protein
MNKNIEPETEETEEEQAPESASGGRTPREKLRAAKARFEKAKVAYAKAQESWQKSRREFTDSISR